jgi:hypothetical protein
VVCELANMLCGSLLSRWERDSRFELGPPELDLPGAAIPESAAVRRSFALEDGVLSVWLEWEPAK